MHVGGQAQSVSTRAFSTSVSVLEKEQKNFGESNHTINRNISIHMMTPSSYNADGTTYAKALTWDVRRVPQ